MNLDGPVRVATTAGSGTASVTLSFANWKGAKVAPTTHAIVVAPAKPGPKAEAVAESFVATLTHPDRKAVIWTVKFSNDGKRLFISGYPSGIVQIFDVESRKETRRIDTPAGLRGSADYALITPDWKTLYVPVEVRKVTSSEKDGKVVQRLEESGRIRSWDVATGEERPDLRPPDGSAPYHATLSPDGRQLLSTERQSFAAGEPRKVGIWAWELQTGARRKLFDGGSYPLFSPDGRTVAVNANDWEAKVHVLKLIDFATGKERASFRCPEKSSIMLGGEFSPDGSIVVADIRGSKEARPAIVFLDAKTLAERGRFVGEPDPEGRGMITASFSPDGKTCILLETTGKAHVWDVGASKEVRSFEVGGQSLA